MDNIVNPVLSRYEASKRKMQLDPEYEKKVRDGNNAASKSIVRGGRRRIAFLKVRHLNYLSLIIVQKLKEIRELWSKIHPQHPLRIIGFGIIDHLLQHPDAYISPKQYDFKTTPSAGDLLEDLQYHKQFFYSVSSDVADDGTFAKFMQGWVDMDNARDPSIHPPYCAFNVRCKSANGLNKCMEDVPVEFDNDGVPVCRTGENDTVEWSFAMTPAYHITRPHLGQCGMGQSILDLFGIQIVYWWIHSKEMMDIFQNLHCSKRGDYTLTALKTWPGLRWTILHPGLFIDMEVGIVHGLMSPINSAVSGWSFMDPKWLVNGRLRELMMWELDIVEKRKNSELVGYDNPDDILGNMKEVLQYWESWLGHSALVRRDKLSLRNLKVEIEERIRDLE
jgi:hypothetical protein